MSDWINPMPAKKLRNFWNVAFLLFALGVMLVVCPGARAQVPTPQTGGSSDGPPPATPAADAPKPKPNPQPKAKPADQTAAKKKSAQKKKQTIDVNTTAEPDKVLYDRAQADLKAGRYIEGRLALQTLINTYPDSEYLAKAKLAVADSYYKEGGTTNLTQSIQEYNDFRTFFPFLDEAAYAQMQIGMAHYRMMEKADRDSTQSKAAEDEFQAFILKYPQSPLVPKAEQYLRDVQEVLGDGEFKVARYYYLKADYRAATARLVEVTDRYPLYSQTDEALWMLGSVYSRAKLASKNEDDKNHWGDLAAKCYDRILQDYPLSKRGVDARARLTSLGLPIPSPDPEALQRMKNDQLWAEQHHQSLLIKRPMGIIKGNPDVSTAARLGQPQMNPPNDVISATDVLKPGVKGPSFTVTGTTGEAPDTDPGNEAAPVDATTQPVGAPATSGTSMGLQIITSPNDASTASETPAATPAGNGTAVAPSSAGPVLAPTPDSRPAPDNSGPPMPPPPAAPVTATD